jgi:hypothetical protein
MLEFVFQIGQVLGQRLEQIGGEQARRDLMSPDSPENLGYLDTIH